MPPTIRPGRASLHSRDRPRYRLLDRLLPKLARADEITDLTITSQIHA
jgi:hypothetical protein